jgi:hypothetical protein
MLKDWFVPLSADTLPDGEILPLEPALAPIVYAGFAANVAEIT